MYQILKKWFTMLVNGEANITTEAMLAKYPITFVATRLSSSILNTNI